MKEATAYTEYTPQKAVNCPHCGDWHGLDGGNFNNVEVVCPRCLKWYIILDTAD